MIGASAAGLPDKTLIRGDRNNFAPRVGLAYRPWDERTVIRAGYGVYFDVVPFSFINGGSPFTLTEQPYTNPLDNPGVTLPRVYPVAGTAGPSSVGIPGAVRPDLQLAYSMQYNFTIERQQWDTGFRLSYLGTNTRQGVYGYNYNSPLPDSRAYLDKLRPFPALPDVRYTTNGAGHQYNAMTTEVTRQMKSGLYFQSSWTWARDLFDVANEGTLENPFDRQRELAWRSRFRRIAGSPRRPTGCHSARAASGSRTSGRAANLLLGGWDFGGVYTAQTGPVPDPAVHRSGPDGHGVHDQPHSGERDAPSRPVERSESAGRQRSLTGGITRGVCGGAGQRRPLRHGSQGHHQGTGHELLEPRRV